MNLQLSPSLMCMNLKTFKDDINFLDSKIESYHIDIMDGHYVKNITLSPWFISQLRELSKSKISTHLMMTHPQDFVLDCIKAGSDVICLHTEIIEKQTFRLINMVKDNGKQFGVVLNPASTLESIKYYIHLLDKITVMTVDPGYAGQKFIPEAVDKIRELAKLKKEKGYKYQIEVDGSCNKNTWKILYEAGTEVYIVGSSGLFGLDSDVSKAWDKMQNDIKTSISK
ncbi:ribulose-phosphate 3-epimerase [Brachyspira pilosicoli WesB]|uniref:Putative D-allulose-6-phosphate 3-epimerase n=1 Tax=Brachyspira pilosicoli WesB TaxID=1161918 RepID=K0JIC0_BRAPL|nr:D-allulose 6-phosphate 3-epimerase [Brachyspira pilosicoli]CCG56642.1 ribulose-phosphate 3-epimerase [Brachyspira pilosicoli WesB]